MPARDLGARAWSNYIAGETPSGLVNEGFGNRPLLADRLLHVIVGLFLSTFGLGQVGELRVDLDEEAVRVAGLEQLRGELVDLAGARALAELFVDVAENRVAPRGVLGAASEMSPETCMASAAASSLRSSMARALASSRRY